MLTIRADVVGSLLRPPELLEARKGLLSGSLSSEEFQAIEDGAVDQAIALQERAGLEVVTDGEQRRLSFQSQMTTAVEGFGEWNLDAFLWGDWKGDVRVGDRRTQRPHSLGVVSKLKKKRWLSVDEFVYLKGRTNRIPKITLPSPSLFSSFWSKQKSSNAYATLEAFLADVTDILKDEVDELVRRGATYIQLDAPHYPLLLDSRFRRFYESLGWASEKWLQAGIEMDNTVIGDHPGVTFGFHLCRGNQGSRWLVEGSYDLIAKAIFKRIGAQRLLLEYDDSRSGSFEPLKEVLLAEDRRIRVSENAFLPVQSLNLGVEQGYVLSRVDGSLTIREVGTLAPEGTEDRVLRLLFGFLVLGLLEFDPPLGEGLFSLRMLMADHRGERQRDQEARSQILTFYEKIRGMEAREILPVEVSAGPEAAKLAYEALQAKFRRDRLSPRLRKELRRELGPTRTKSISLMAYPTR